mmetsp:Transcript_41976/g.83052  ORF Transcript_41976/g.83052 Transcript_41976/m.83052 type:complete len:204 (+) Transcript_41976:208-819(+)
MCNKPYTALATRACAVCLTKGVKLRLAPRAILDVTDFCQNFRLKLQNSVVLFAQYPSRHVISIPCLGDFHGDTCIHCLLAFLMRMSKTAIRPVFAAASVIELAHFPFAKLPLKLRLAVRITTILVSATIALGHSFAHDCSIQVRFLSHFLHTMGKPAVLRKLAVTVIMKILAKLCLVEVHLLPFRSTTFLHGPLKTNTKSHRT